MTFQLKHAIAGNLAVGSFGRIITGLQPLLLVPFMLRTWGVDVYGEWLILTAIPAYIMLAPDFGLAGVAANRMAHLTAEGKEQEAVYLYRSTFVIQIVGASGFAILGWLIAWLIDWSRVGVNTFGSTSSTLIIGLSCLQIFITQQGSLLSGIYRSARCNPRYGLLQSLGQLFCLVVSLLVLFLHGTPIQFITALLFSYVLIFVVIFLDSRRIMPSFTLTFRGVSLQRIRPYILPGLGFAGMPLLNALQNQGVLLVLGATLGPANVALFQTARVLSNGIKSLLGLLGSSIMTELPALLGENKKEQIEYLLIRNTQVGFLLAISMILIVSFSGREIYQVWLGGQVPYYPAMVILLLVSLLPSVAGQSFSMLLFASNQIHLAVLPLLVVAIASISYVSIAAFVTDLPTTMLGIIMWEGGAAFVYLRIVALNGLDIRGYFIKCLNLSFLLTGLRLAVNHMITLLKR